VTKTVFNIFLKTKIYHFSMVFFVFSLSGIVFFGLHLQIALFYSLDSYSMKNQELTTKKYINVV